jgi:uncharacterized protein with von Willebrand factor type A (vWA) domain
MSMGEPFNRLMLFVEQLRDSGVPVAMQDVIQFYEATSLIGLKHLYWIGRSTLIHDEAHEPVYTEVFRRHWYGPVGIEPPPDAPPRRAVDRDTATAPSAAQPSTTGAERGEDPSQASAIELLRDKDFGEFEETDYMLIRDQLLELLEQLPVRCGRRKRRASRGDLDLRRTVACTLRSGGESAQRSWVRRTPEARRLVFLVDVSGSMSKYSQAFMALGNAALRSGHPCEAFAFATRLTRCTRELAQRDYRRAIADVTRVVSDWDSGTRIGESLKAFLDEFDRRGVARGAYVIICSDGLDAGDPTLLQVQMERLARLAHRVVWLNPLKAQENYEPLARGMAAALPYADTFASGHSLDNLAASLVGAVRREADRAEVRG